MLMPLLAQLEERKTVIAPSCYLEALGSIPREGIIILLFLGQLLCCSMCTNPWQCKVGLTGTRKAAYTLRVAQLWPHVQQPLWLLWSAHQ